MVATSIVLRTDVAPSTINSEERFVNRENIRRAVLAWRLGLSSPPTLRCGEYLERQEEMTSWLILIAVWLRSLPERNQRRFLDTRLH